MRAGDVIIGALNLYRYSPGEWPADELETAQVLADMASGYIVNARTLSASRELAQQLQAGHARNHRRNLHEVAQEVVDGTLTI